MDALIGAYLPSDALGYVSQLFSLVPAGLVLGVLVWMVASVIRFGFDVIRRS